MVQNIRHRGMVETDLSSKTHQLYRDPGVTDDDTWWEAEITKAIVLTKSLKMQAGADFSELEQDEDEQDDNEEARAEANTNTERNQMLGDAVRQILMSMSDRQRTERFHLFSAAHFISQRQMDRGRRTEKYSLDLGYSAMSSRL